jgi:hypothetical protein
MLITLGLVALFVVAVVLLKRKGAKHHKSPRGSGAVETFVHEVVARELTKKSGLGFEAALSALRGDPDPEVVSKLEELVRSVEVGFLRLTDGDAFEVRLDIQFEDGTSKSSSRRVTLQELPSAIRDELSRTGASRAYRTWEFPWSGGETRWLAD